MRKSIFYDKAKRSNKAKPDVSAWVKGICTVHESKRFTAIFYWIALVACLAVICSAFADAGNISIDGYVQPGEAGVHASISALEKRRLHWMPMETPKLLEFPMKCRRRANINRMVIMVIMCWRQQLSARRLYLRKI